MEPIHLIAVRRFKNLVAHLFEDLIAGYVIGISESVMNCGVQVPSRAYRVWVRVCSRLWRRRAELRRVRHSAATPVINHASPAVLRKISNTVVAFEGVEVKVT